MTAEPQYLAASSPLESIIANVTAALRLTPGQHKQAEERYHSVGEWLLKDGGGFEIYRPEIYPQGSLAIDTTMRPRGRNEFDLDLVLELGGVDPRKIENPIALLDALEARLKESLIYRIMLRRKNRCIRLEYANLFHMDILPACPDPARPGAVLVPDRE